MINNVLFLDHASTTPVHPLVIQTIAETLTDVYGNPSSLHTPGRQAKAILDTSRQAIARRINADPSGIIFTSGACEANSLALQGYLDLYDDSVLITTPIEHKSILALCEEKFPNTVYIPVDENGFVSPGHLDRICAGLFSRRRPHLLVSIQAANSEIGTVQNLKRLSEIVHQYGGVFHTDATQLFPYEKIDVRNTGIDLLSMSGQKIRAPKGVGFLYTGSDIRLKPLIYGSQMEGRRGGTENIPYIAGLKKAVELIDYDATDMTAVRDYMLRKLEGYGALCRINGPLKNRLPNNINISFRNTDGEALLLLLDSFGICVSAGSACNSDALLPSPVLTAIGVPQEYIHGTLRITLSTDTTQKEADYFLKNLQTSLAILHTMTKHEKTR